jgi:Rad3-related DNA helicase
MSGTLPERTTRILAGTRTFKHLSYPYLTPAENRPVYYDPLPIEHRTSVPHQAAKIRELFLKHGKCATIVHAAYGTQAALAKELADLNPFTNGPSNKRDVEERFRAKGGLWIASGVSEGVDLPDDYCRLLIVPTILFADRSSPYVAKRRGMEDGLEWYAVKALENTIQRLGRGVRHQSDKCDMYILDGYWSQLYKAFGKQFEPLNMVWAHND